MSEAPAVAGNSAGGYSQMMIVREEASSPAESHLCSASVETGGKTANKPHPSLLVRKLFPSAYKATAKGLEDWDLLVAVD